ncbi:hypothetical protein ALC60_11642 [Trachymyrmex zeteki]|uniref:Uncharacterized protein n=1 Tax=Mycetomoellerius zeteki TaxID=64791 RepID=A0A151WNA1_9HYME|nr:hypothetical protein ALC60_11642 [Trachymyrmex zeteki]
MAKSYPIDCANPRRRHRKIYLYVRYQDTIVVTDRQRHCRPSLSSRDDDGDDVIFS